MDDKIEQEQPAPPAPKKPTRRGAKYTGDGIEYIPGVPMRDLTWAETRQHFGNSYAARRHAIEVVYKHLYTWGEPEEDTPEDDN